MTEKELVQVLQSQLTVLNDEIGELARIKNDLMKQQATKASMLEDSLYSPKLFEHYKQVANFMSKSEVIPKDYKGKPHDIFIAMAAGYQLGIAVEQSLNYISVINGRPCLWGDAVIGLVLGHPECEDIQELPIYGKGDTIVGYQCTVIRRGHSPHTKTFTYSQAQQANLTNRPTWQSYPERMLQMRARSLALRDKFADVLSGIEVREVAEDDAITIAKENYSQKQSSAQQHQTQTEKLLSILRKAEQNNVNSEHIDPSNNENLDQAADEMVTSESHELSELERMGEDKPKAIETSTNDVPNTSVIEKASDAQISAIEALFSIANLDNARIKKALSQFGAKSLLSLSNEQADKLINQLEKIAGTA